MKTWRFVTYLLPRCTAISCAVDAIVGSNDASIFVAEGDINNLNGRRQCCSGPCFAKVLTLGKAGVPSPEDSVEIPNGATFIDRLLFTDRCGRNDVPLCREIARSDQQE